MLVGSVEVGEESMGGFPLIEVSGGDFERGRQHGEEASDLVGTAVFLASADSDFVSGQVICVDGGTLML